MSSVSYQAPLVSALRRGGLAPATYLAYRRAVNNFLRDCNLKYTQLIQLSVRLIDLWLAAWLEAEFEAGGSRAYGENTRNGLHFYIPKCRHRLHESHLRLKGWKRQKPGKSYPPLPRNIATLVSVHLAARGDWLACVAVLLSFDCYLRINECCNLKVGDIRIPKDRRLGEPYLHSAVHLRTTKTIDNLTCTVSDPVLARILHRMIIGRQPSERLFPFTASTLRDRHFKSTLRNLGLGHLGFVPHSLRHGGATHDFVIVGKSESYVTKRGRWASSKNAHRYMQTLAAVDLTYAVPRDMDQQGRDFHEQLELVLDSAIGSRLPPLPPLSRAVKDARTW